MVMYTASDAQYCCQMAELYCMWCECMLLLHVNCCAWTTAECDNACRFAQGSEANGIHQLLDEVLSTALERALEPQLLEGMVLENIMKAYHNKE